MQRQSFVFLSHVTRFIDPACKSELIVGHLRGAEFPAWEEAARFDRGSCESDIVVQFSGFIIARAAWFESRYYDSETPESDQYTVSRPTNIQIARSANSRAGLPTGKLPQDFRFGILAKQIQPKTICYSTSCSGSREREREREREC